MTAALELWLRLSQRELSAAEATAYVEAAMRRVARRIRAQESTARCSGVEEHAHKLG